MSTIWTFVPLHIVKIGRKQEKALLRANTLHNTKTRGKGIKITRLLECSFKCPVFGSPLYIFLSVFLS